MNSPTPANRILIRIKYIIKLMAVNTAVLLVVLLPIELIFGNWFRPVGLNDLKRFTIPVGVSYQLDVTDLYGEGEKRIITYTRDEWGLRGKYASLRQIDVLTIGGSTTDQKCQDDRETWQTVAQKETDKKGKPLIFANAGVDGQTTAGHIFNFQYWLPLLKDLKPKIVLFYCGINDVLANEGREQFDRKTDVSSWRVKSALYQLYRIVKGNFMAHEAKVTHGKMRILSPSEFTNDGILTPEQRSVVARRLTEGYLHRIDRLRQYAIAFGATPIFVTQTAYAWNADNKKPRGLKDTLRSNYQGFTMNYADVAFLHQGLNQSLMAYCNENNIICFDLANEVRFEVSDYYDFTHNTPRGAEKIGKHIAEKLVQIEMPSKQ